MNNIEKLLTIGDLRSVGRSEQVVDMTLKEPLLFQHIVNALFAERPATKMRAADAIEKITRQHPEWLQPYKKLFLTKVSKIEQKEVRWHFAQIVPRFSLTGSEREQIFQLMISFLDDKSQIVKTFAMQALADLAMQEEKYVLPVKKIVNDLLKNGAPSQQSRARKLLLTLEAPPLT